MRTQRSTVRRLASIAALALALVLLAPLLAAGGSGSGAVSNAPNVVVILTDDQHVGSLRFMPRTTALLGERGTTFRNSFVTTPLCCPARASLLTGQYAHNHGVLANRPPNGGYAALDGAETLPVWLNRAGYRTAFAGKYLNGYGRKRPRAVPRGWDRWSAQLSPLLFDHRMSENGRVVSYGDNPADYATDVLADSAVDFIEKRAGRARPFFLMVAPSAPHREPRRQVRKGPNPRPAPRHAGELRAEPLPRPPSFDEADVRDKPPPIRALPRLGRDDVAVIARRYRARLESLLAVDTLVRRVVRELSAAGKLDDTLIVFTSDNGFFHGEHRIRGDKRNVYEESIRVPLIVRGPGAPAGEARDQLVTNLDLAPTILALAGAAPGAGHALDGRSLLPVLDDPEAALRDDLLLEYFKDPGYRAKPYAAVRTPRHVYVQYDGGAEELYDLRADPYQLESLHADRSHAALRRLLAARLEQLRDCAGESCR